MKYITSLSGPCCPGPEYLIDLSKSNVPLTTGGVENAHMKEKIIVIIDDPKLVDITTIKTYPNTKITPLGDGKYEIVMPSNDIKIYGVSNDDPRLIVKYNVEDDTNPTQLYTYSSGNGITGATMFDKVEIDGTEVSIADLDTTRGAYQLTAGKHTVKYTLKDPVFIGDHVFMSCTSLTNVIIPNSVINIGNSAFNYCTSLTSVTIPNSVTSIGEYVFYNCTALTSVVIGNNVISIGQYAFRNCTSLTNIIISNSVTNISSGAFRDCTSLTSITIPDSVTSIGNNAFNGCTALTTVTIPDNVTSIGNYAFYNCSSLISVTIPNSVTSIGPSAFQGCSGLRTVTIGNGVTSISGGAFVNCNGLTSVTINATTPPTLINSSAFIDTNSCPIYVPAQSVDTYKTANVWSVYADRIQTIP